MQRGKPNHWSDFIDPSDLPSQFERMQSIQAQSDLIRISLLKKYGGVWIDINMILLRAVDDFCIKSVNTSDINQPIMCGLYNTEWSTTEDGFNHDDRFESFFIQTTKNNPFVEKWHWGNNKYWENPGQLSSTNLMGNAFFRGFQIDSMFTGPWRDYLWVYMVNRKLIKNDHLSRRIYKNNTIKYDVDKTASRLNRLFKYEDIFN